MSTKICPKCKNPLKKLSEGKLVIDLKPGQSIHEAPGTEWETYTCQTKDCEYYNKKLVWDKSKGVWKELS